MNTSLVAVDGQLQGVHDHPVGVVRDVGVRQVGSDRKVELSQDERVVALGLLHEASAAAARGDPGGNCIKIGIPGKSILRECFQENRTSWGLLHKIVRFETYLPVGTFK